jgi:hypothetical protein
VPKIQPIKKQRQGCGLRLILNRRGMTATQASGERLKFGNEIIRRAAETNAIPQSAREGVTERTRVVNPENRPVIPGVTREGVETAFSISAEFIKMPDQPVKVSLVSAEEVQRRRREKYFLAGR